MQVNAAVINIMWSHFMVGIVWYCLTSVPLASDNVWAKCALLTIFV